MKTNKYLIFYTFLILIIISCNSNNDLTDNTELNSVEYYEELDVSYGADPYQTYDIYLPANRSLNTNIMILIHGGGWSAGDKSDMNSIKNFIRNEFPNIGVVNMNYRLSDANTPPYPMQINDITSVINKLKTNQNYYIIDNDFAFIGTSAGAHLSLLWTYAFDTQNDIDMVCSIVGPTNFTDPAYLNTADSTIQELLDLYGINATTAYLEEISPYHQVTSNAAPTILFYGGMDPLVPTSQGQAMHEKLNTLGVTNQFTLYPNSGHGWTGLNLLDTSAKLKTFIETHFN
ncbi:alpha/beta hydrolase fold domain-containing protein [Bizionia sp. KMM 8389]